MSEDADFADAVSLLMTKRAELLGQLARVDAAIQALQGLSKTALRDPAIRERNLIPPSQVAEKARDTLLRLGRPTKRRDLVSAMVAQGIPIAGHDKAKGLGTILWRHRDQFESIPGQGYWVRGAPIPASRASLPV